MCMTNQRDNIGLQQLHVYINLSILRLIIILKSIDCCSRISPIMIIVYHSYLVETLSWYSNNSNSLDTRHGVQIL